MLNVFSKISYCVSTVTYDLYELKSNVLVYIFVMLIPKQEMAYFLATLCFKCHYTTHRVVELRLGYIIPPVRRRDCWSVVFRYPVYTIQPVSKPVVQPVVKRGCTTG